MATNFQINGKSFDDFFIPRDLFSQGGLWTWGNNNNGALGDNTTDSKSSPVQTVAGGTNWKQIYSGGATVAGIKTDGTLWLWGSNASGQLGNNTIVNKSSPVQTVAGGTNWKSVAPGNATAAIKTDGTLWMWGYGGEGMLGDNAITDRSSPVQTVAGGWIWKQASIGASHTAAIKTDGTLWLWGYNLDGELGDNTFVSKSSPVQTVAAGTNWKQVVCAGYTVAAIKTDGTLWTWGDNFAGALGSNNQVVARSSPIQTVSGGTNWKTLASFSAPGIVSAIKTDGTLWLWGSNANGMLGNNTIVDKSSPIQTVAGGTNWKQLGQGNNGCAAIKTDGTLWTWGYNIDGQLGDNTQISKSSPVQTVAGGTNWKQVAGGNQTIAIREDFY
jgi:alpha-tubulin suppressor-like RCC1 family protein